MHKAVAYRDITEMSFCPLTPHFFLLDAFTGIGCRPGGECSSISFSWFQSLHWPLCARDSWTVMIVRISLGLCLTPTTLEYCGRRWLHPLSIHWAAFIFGGVGVLKAQQVQKFPGWNVLSPFRGKGGPALSGFLSVQVRMIVTEKNSVLSFFIFFFW